MVTLERADAQDFALWQSFDPHLAESEYRFKAEAGRCLFVHEAGQAVGVLRWQLFWDWIPFVTLLWLTGDRRGRGVGRQAMEQWEAQMRAGGHRLAMTSTMAEEDAQHFYHRLGYHDCGCLVKNCPPLVENMEIFLIKAL